MCPGGVLPTIPVFVSGMRDSRSVCIYLLEAIRGDVQGGMSRYII